MNSLMHANTHTHAHLHAYQAKTLLELVGRAFPNGGRFGILARDVYSVGGTPQKAPLGAFQRLIIRGWGEGGMIGKMVSWGTFSRLKPSPRGNFRVGGNLGYYISQNHSLCH